MCVVAVVELPVGVKTIVATEDRNIFRQNHAGKDYVWAGIIYWNI